MPRRLAIVLLAVFGLFALTVLAASMWIQAWIPTRGKAWLEAKLEQALPLDITIGRVSYSAWSGLQLDGIAAVDPKTSTTWFHAAQLHARIGIVPLLLRRTVAFRLNGSVTTPCQTELDVAGRYQLQTRRVAVDVSTSDIAVEHLSEPLVAYRPPELKSAALRLRWHIDWQPGAPPVLSGRTLLTDVVWERAPIRITGNLAVDGTVRPTPGSALPVSVTAQAAVDRARITGLAVVGETTDIHGSLRVHDGVLDVVELRGAALGSSWTLEGSVWDVHHPTVELHLRTPVDLARLAQQLLAAVQTLKPQGAAQLDAVLRGPLRDWPNIELMATSAIRDGRCVVPTLAEPIQRIAGTLRYDHLSKRVELIALSGQLRDAPIHLAGTIRLTNPTTLNLDADTVADLSLVRDVRPDMAKIFAQLSGAASVRAKISGAIGDLSWSAATTLDRALVAWQSPPVAIEDVAGTIVITEREIHTNDLAFVFAKEPVTVRAIVSSYTSTPQITGTIQAGNATMQIAGTIRSDRVTMQRAQLTLGQLQLAADGTIAREANTRSTLNVSGTVDADALRQLPWVKLPALDDWQVHGQAAVRARLSGPLEHWQRTEIVGQFASDEVIIRHLPLRTIRGEIEQQDGKLSLRLLNAVFVDGRLTGQWQVDHTSTPPRFALEFDVNQADLGQLSAAIPALKNNYIDGRVSGRAKLAGVWSDPQRLVGDGWVSAMGERLAELPLLDRVLHGIFGVLGERFGLSSLRTAQITKIGGQWRLADGRVHSDDLQLTGAAGTEPLSIYAHGSVGLDKSLDIVVEPELSQELVAEAPNTSAFSRTILQTVGGFDKFRRLIGQHHIGGTIDKPQYRFELSLDELFKQAIPFGLNQLLAPGGKSQSP